MGIVNTCNRQLISDINQVDQLDVKSIIVLTFHIEYFLCLIIVSLVTNSS